MSERVEHWASISFGDLNEYRSGTINPADHPEEVFELYSVPIFPTGKPEIIKGSSIGSTKQLVTPGDVLVCKINPRINRVWQVAPQSGLRQIASSEWIVLRAPLINSAYLRRYFSSPEFRELLCTDLTGVGGSLTRAQPSRVARFDVPLAPLPQQKRIANKLEAVLSRVDACRARLARVPDLLKRFRQSVLAAAISGDLTENWRETAKVSEWETVSLEDVADGFSYGSSAKSSKVGRVPVLRMGNIQNGVLDWEDLVYTSDSDEIAKYELEPGDVLFNRTNSPELVGKTAVYQGERQAIYAGYIIKVKCSRKLLPDFLSYALNSPAGRDYCWRVKSDGVSQSNINARKLAAFDFQLPSIPEQQEIVSRVESLFAFASRIDADLKRAQATVDRLAPSTLAKAFRGELVRQDLNDEPASVLLERIRNQQTAVVAKPRRKSSRSAPKMKKLTKEGLKRTIQELPRKEFDFDQLQRAVSADYDELSGILIGLLGEPSPILRQEFDEKAKKMRFARIAK